MTENQHTTFTELLEVYAAVDVNRDQDVLHNKAKILLKLRDWYLSLCDFDPISQHVFPSSLSQVAHNVSGRGPCKGDNELGDRFTQIIDWAFDAITSILSLPNEKIIREHDMVALNRVKEIDNKTIEWLSRQTGRNFREKLVGKNSIKAISKRLSLDTLENRVLKALLFKIEALLFTKLETLGLTEKQEDLLQKIQSWFNSEGVLEIKQLTHVAPTNILLQDKHYKKIWRSWLDMQYLDENIREDDANQASYYLTAVLWKTLATLQNNPCISMLEQPCYFEYDSFKLNLNESIECMYYPQKINTPVASISHINEDKGFAFAMHKGKKLFCHISSFPSKASFKTAKKNDYITFDVVETPKGLEAKNIKTVCAKPLLIKITFDPKSNKITLSTVKSVTYIQVVEERIYHIDKNDSCIKSYNFDFSLISEISNCLIKQMLELPKVNKQSNDLLIGQISSVNKPHATIELQSLSPRIMIGNNKCIDLNLQLITQFWQSDDDDNIQIDCSLSRALLIKDNIQTLSFNSIFNDNLNIDPTLKNNALSFFAEKIKKKLTVNENSVESLNYLVPDHLSDFATEPLRHCINANFKNASPLPKSIAAVFCLQQILKLQTKTIRAGDIYLLIDNSYEGVQVTPVIANYNTELKNHPCSGITWERHPSTKINGKSESHLITLASSESVAKDLSELFNFDDLFNKKKNLSLICENDNNEKVWNKIPDNFKDRLREETKGNPVKFDELQNIIKGLKEVIGAFKGQVHCLPLSKSLIKPNEVEKNESWNWIKHPIDLVKGGQVLSDWQQQLPSIYLWQDHLPKLSTRTLVNDIEKDIYLVNKAVIQPQRGKKVAIPIDEVFTLPANYKIVKLPLNIGNSKGRPKFEVQVQHGSFPLQESIDCTLELTYTYGDETPYQLIFKPVDGKETNFKSIAGKWMKYERKVLFPEYPPVGSWDKENQGLRKDHFFSLLNNVSDILVYGRSSSVIKKAPQGKSFGFTGDNLFIYLNGSDSKISVNDTVYFYKVTDGDKFKGVDVSLDPKASPKSFLSKLRPILYSLFKEGRSIYDETAPLDIREKVSSAIGPAITVFQMEGITDAFQKEVLMFLCCLHQDCPPIISNKLLEISVSNQISKHRLHLAYSLGSLKKEWQLNLLKNLLSSLQEANEDEKNKAILEIISIAIWRNIKFIDALSSENITLIIASACRILNNAKLSQPTEYNRASFEWVAVIRCLELLLALIRTRSSSDSSIKVLLSYEHNLTIKIIKTIDKFKKRYGELLGKLLLTPKNYIETRVSLSINKPEHIRTPDLLFALNLYLTGETGADLIKITGVSD